MKKALSLMIALVMACSLVGCAESGQSSEEVKEIELNKSNFLDYVSVKGQYVDHEFDIAEIAGVELYIYSVTFELEIIPVKAGNFEDVKIDFMVHVGDNGDSWALSEPEEYNVPGMNNLANVKTKLPIDGRFSDKIEFVCMDDYAPCPVYSEEDIEILSVSGTFIKD